MRYTIFIGDTNVGKIICDPWESDEWTSPIDRTKNKDIVCLMDMELVSVEEEKRIYKIL